MGCRSNKSRFLRACSLCVLSRAQSTACKDHLVEDSMTIEDRALGEALSIAC